MSVKILMGLTPIFRADYMKMLSVCFFFTLVDASNLQTWKSQAALKTPSVLSFVLEGL